MKVIIFPKQEFDSTLKNKGITDENVQSFPIMFISINDTIGSYSKPYFQKDHYNVLTLYFDDVEKDGLVSPTNEEEGYTKAFSEEQAKQIIDFIDKNKNMNGAFVHCAAGISRSGAVGEFIAEYFNEDMEEFQRNNPYIFPNKKVTQLLHRALWKKYKNIENDEATKEND